METEPNVFIVESLRFTDENKLRYEGKILHDLLKLSGKNPIYYYIRTQKELIRIIDKFEESKYRYLHLSCHGNANQICLTLDNIDFQEFGNIIKTYIDKKRIFVSACSILNNNFVKNVLQNSGCFSVVGPQKKIKFNDAAISFLSLYHMMFKVNEDLIKNITVAESLGKILLAFNIKLEGYHLRNGKYIKSSDLKIDIEKLKDNPSLSTYFNIKIK